MHACLFSTHGTVVLAASRPAGGPIPTNGGRGDDNELRLRGFQDGRLPCWCCESRRQRSMALAFDAGTSISWTVSTGWDLQKKKPLLCRRIEPPFRDLPRSGTLDDEAWGRERAWRKVAVCRAGLDIDRIDPRQEAVERLFRRNQLKISTQTSQ